MILNHGLPRGSNHYRARDRRADRALEVCLGSNKHFVSHSRYPWEVLGIRPALGRHPSNTGNAFTRATNGKKLGSKSSLRKIRSLPNMPKKDILGAHLPSKSHSPKSCLLGMQARAESGTHTTEIGPKTGLEHPHQRCSPLHQNACSSAVRDAQ